MVGKPLVSDPTGAPGKVDPSCVSIRLLTAHVKTFLVLQPFVSVTRSGAKPVTATVGDVVLCKVCFRTTCNCCSAAECLHAGS